MPQTLIKGLPRNVLVLGAVSLLNDSASEIITPLLPVFLTLALGTGPAIVGLVEGLAEGTASLLKLASGWLADRGWNAKRIVVGGYAVSNVARPMIGLALGWPWVMGLRFLDRVGKGLRTSPRDAMIAAAVPASMRGRAFGFHRGMDHAGAMIGPLFAFALLTAGLEMQQVFLASAIPGVIALLVLIVGLETPATVKVEPPPPLRWRDLDGRLRGLIVASGALAFASVPEAFVVLWAIGSGLEVAYVPLLWAAAHLIKAAVSLPAGIISDRIGRLPVVAGGWAARVVVLFAIGFATDGPLLVWLLFIAYGVSLAITEGAERALIGDHAPATHKATAFGIYHLVSSVLLLPGALLFGLIWEWAGRTTAFLTAAALTALSAAMLLLVVRREVVGRR
jgi:MFS family permease